MRLHPPAALLCLGLLPAAVATWASSAHAAIPQGYTGTPYKGTPQAIPGRVELADLDEGGLNVAFFADHRRENAVGEGYSPISGDDYRVGNLDLPNICKTNKALEPGGVGSEDFWEDGSRYPSEANKFEYYMGYAHTVDWVRVTVNVAQAGTYNVSSDWACANPNCGLSIWFNDGTTKTDNPDRPMDGENKSGIIMLPGTNDYHKWRKYPNFAKVTLSAGVQLMTFNLEVADHLQYGHLVFELVGGGGGQGSGGSSAGGAAAGGQGSGGASVAGGAPGGGGGTPSAGGALGAGGTSASGSGPGSTGGALGLPGAPTGGSSAAGTGTGAPAAASSQDSSGCALVASSSTSSSSFASLGLLLGSSLLLRRRRVSRRRSA